MTLTCTNNPETGEETEEFFAAPIRFEDEYGNLVEIDPSLVESEKQDYAFESSAGESTNFFPETIDEDTPFLLTYADYEIRFTVLADNELTLIEIEDLEFTDPFSEVEERPLAAYYSIDEDTSFRVTSSDIGIKSEFILYTLPETNVFTYELELTNLQAYLSKETTTIALFCLSDETTQTPIAIIPEGIMWDSQYCEEYRLYSSDITYELYRIEEGRYELSLIVCEYYLNCESRIFPITVDPTITWQGTFASRPDGRGFTSTFVRSGANFANSVGSTAVLPIGRGTEGVSRSFVRGDNLATTIRGRSVTDATLHLRQRNVSSHTRNVNVSIHRTLCATGNQTNSMNAKTWNNRPLHLVAAITSARTGTVNWSHSYNVTSWARDVANSNITHRALCIRAVDESLSQYAQFYGAGAVSANNRPRMVITTVNPPTAPTSITLSDPFWAPGQPLPLLRWSGASSTRRIIGFQYRIVSANICPDTGNHSAGTNIISAFTQGSLLTVAQGANGYRLPITNLAQGCYRVAVRAVDDTGAVGSMMSLSLHVDRTAPTFTGLSLNPSNTTSTAPSNLPPAISWTNINDTPWCNGTRITLEAFIRRPDGTTGPTRNIINNRAPARTGLGAGNTLDRRELFRPDMLLGRPTQAHTLVVRARDRVGNTREQSFQYFYDSSLLTLGSATLANQPSSGWFSTNTLPSVTWQGLAHTNRLGANINVNRRVQVSFTSQGAAASSFYNLSTLSQNTTGTNALPAALVNAHQSLPDGRHTIRLRASNEHGRIGSNIVSVPFQIDTTPPVLDLALSRQTSGEMLASSSYNNDFTNAPIVSGELRLDVVIDEHRDASGFDIANSSLTLEGVNVAHTSNLALQSISWNQTLNTRMLGQDGIYRMTFTGQDRAGNVAESAILYFEVRNLLAAPVITPLFPGGTSSDCGNFTFNWNFVTGGASTRSAIQWALVTDTCDTTDPDTLVWTTIEGSANQGSFNVESPRDEQGNPIPGTFTLFVRALDLDKHPGHISCLELQVQQENEGTDRPLVGFTPLNFNSRDRLDYRTHFYWESVADRPSDITYEILYSRLENTPLEFWNVIATGLDANTFASPNFNYSQDFFYKVRPVRIVEVDGQKVRYTGEPSNIATSRAADENEFGKRLGVQCYWAYQVVETPVGNAQIELSQGNLVYSMIDRYLENDAMLQDGITRVHNSQSSLIFSFGQGTDFSYNVELLRQQNGQSYVFKDATGTLRTFVWNDFHQTYFTRDSMRIRMERFDYPKQVRVRTNFGSGNQAHQYENLLVGYIVTSHRQREYWFNQGGQLVYITDTPLQLHAELPQGQTYFIANHDMPNLTFTYCADTGLLRSATSRGIRSMYFAHNEQRLVSAVWLPDQSVISYTYDNKRLVEVRQHENLLSEADFLAGTLPNNNANDIYHTYTWEPLGFAESALSFLGIGQQRYFKTGINGIPRTIGAETPTAAITYERDRDDEMMVRTTSITTVLGDRTDIAYCLGNATSPLTITYVENTPYGLNAPATTTRSTLCSFGHPIFTEVGTVEDVAQGSGQNTAQTWQNHLLTSTTIVAEYHELSADGTVSINRTSRTTTTNYNALQLPATTTECSGVTIIKEYNAEGINEEKATRDAAYCADGYLWYDEHFEYSDCGGMEVLTDTVYETVASQEFCNFTGNILNATTYLQAFQDGEKYGLAVLQNTTVFTYDAHNNLIRTTSTNHGSPDVTTETSKEYDGLGRLIYQSEGIRVGSQLTSVFSVRNTFDRQGREISSTVTEPNGEQRRTEAVFNRDGTLASQTCELGIRTTAIHDLAGRTLSSTTYVPGREPQTATMEYGFTSIDLNTLEGTRRVEGLQVTTSTDSAGLVSRTYTNALGQTVRTYMSGINTDSVFTADGHTFATITLPESLPREDADISISLLNADGNQTHVINHPEISEGVFRVGTNSIVTSQAFGGAGRVTSSTDALGNTTNFSYTETGGLASIARPESLHIQPNSLDTVRAQATARFIDDEIVEGGTLSSVIDPLGRLRQIRKDAGGRVLSITDFGQAQAVAGTGIVVTYTHNEQGQVIREAFTNGDHKLFFYDLNGNQTRVEWRRANGTLEQSQVKEYDSQNRLIAVTDYKHTGNSQEVIYYQRFTYDIGGRRISSFEGHTRPNNITDDMKSRYIFDAAGRLIERRYPQAPDIASNHNAVTAQIYTFDDFGRLCTIKVRVSGQEQILREYVYDAWGRVVETKTRTNFANGGTDYIAKRYTYTDFGQVESMKYFRSADLNTPIESFVYTYDKNGQILTEHHISNLINPPHDEKRSYTYNENGRLIRSESTLSGVVEYGFDKVGNRRVVTTNGEQEISYYTGLDQILRKTSSAGTTNFTHCPNGNLISEVSPTQTRLFSYSVDNRLTEVRQGSTQANASVIQTNVFRGDGQRITKSEEAQTINYTYRAGQVLYTTDELGNRRAFNLYSPAGNIIAARQYCSSSNHQGEYVTYLADIRGSITSIVDDNMNFIQGYRYTDYGITTRIGSGVFNEFAYTQGIWDETTGLYYLNARFYNPADGRFLTQDPYRGSNDQPDTWHLYAYCAGDPINWIDPSGNRMVVFGNANNRTLLRNHLQRLTRYLVVLRGSTGLTREVRVDTCSRSRRPGSPRPNGNRLIRRIINHNRTVTIHRITQGGNEAAVGNNRNAIVNYNPNANSLIPTRDRNSDLVRMRTRAPEIGLAHELIHADRAIRGRLLSGRSNWGFRFRDSNGTRWRVVSTLREELATIGLRYHGTNDVTENQIRGERGNRLRGAY